MLLRRKGLRARLAAGVVSFILPLLVLMPLLHAHPPGTPVVGHPSGLHLPSVLLRSPAGTPAAAAAVLQCAAGDGMAPVTLVVQEARHRSTDAEVSSERATFIQRLRGPVVVAAAEALARAPQFPAWPTALPHEHQPQAPPAARTTAA